MRNDRADKATKETENNDSGGTNCRDKEKKTLKACQQEYTEKSTLVGTTWREKHDSALTMSPHRQPPPHPILTALLRYAKKIASIALERFFVDKRFSALSFGDHQGRVRRNVTTDEIFKHPSQVSSISMTNSVGWVQPSEATLREEKCPLRQCVRRLLRG